MTSPSPSPSQCKHEQTNMLEGDFGRKPNVALICLKCKMEWKLTPLGVRDQVTGVYTMKE